MGPVLWWQWAVLLTPEVKQSLERPDWYHALSLIERSELLRNMRISEANRNLKIDLARSVSNYYASSSPFLDEHFPKGLAETSGLNQEWLILALSEPVDVIKRRNSKVPDWLIELARAYTAHSSFKFDDNFTENKYGMKFGLLNIITPLIAQAHRKLTREAKLMVQEFNFATVLTDNLLQALCPTLPKQLFLIISRSMALELNISRIEGTLNGRTSQERFQDFCQQLCIPEKALAVLSEYPVMARNICKEM